MGDNTKPVIAMHCFDNLVAFLTIHKHETDDFSVQWRTLLLQVMLSGVESLQPEVQEKHLSRFKTCK